MADDFLIPTVGGCGVEIGRAAGAPRVEVVDVEMEDDFSHPIPAIPSIIVSTFPTSLQDSSASYNSVSRSHLLTNNSQGLSAFG